MAPRSRAANFFTTSYRSRCFYPMILLATAATVIASQALISGAFSLGAQAIRLGLFPRLDLLHTHQAHAGQVYVSFINWSLCAGCILLVVAFGSSSALAAAYGLAVSGVMLITSVAMFPIARHYWKWRRGQRRFRVGRADRGQCDVPDCKLTQICRRRLCTAFDRPHRVRGDDDLALGPQQTFAAYSAKSTMTMAELVALHRGCKVFVERNALVMSPKPLRLPSDRVPSADADAMGAPRICRAT